MRPQDHPFYDPDIGQTRMPIRPKDAVDCEICKGRGWNWYGASFLGFREMCWRCEGRGWMLLREKEKL
jgi:DnaJ-class molecular chaperone